MTGSMGAITLAEIAELLDRKAPSTCAAKWDNVGLLAGDPAWTTPGVVFSVDLTAEALDEAKAQGFKLIVTHHPPIFPGPTKGGGLGRVVPSSAGGVGDILFRCLEAGVGVFSSHTNFDQCALEVVESVAKGLGVRPRGRFLDHGPETSLLKLVTYVPEENLEAVRAAVFRAGAGNVGRYDSCGFEMSGTGSFRGGDDTKPAIGKPGKLERVKEVRLETILPRGLVKQVVRALVEAHPYEEVAYDLFAVEQRASSQTLLSGLGYGFFGDFEKPLLFSDLIKSVRRIFPDTQIVTYGVGDPLVERVGFVAGKGSSFLRSALEEGCQVFITGEVEYHDALSAVSSGLKVIELGHTESEFWFSEVMEKWISEWTGRLKTKKVWTPIRSTEF